MLGPSRSCEGCCAATAGPRLLPGLPPPPSPPHAPPQPPTRPAPANHLPAGAAQVRTLQLEMEYCYGALEDEARDIVGDPKGGDLQVGGSVRG